MSFLAITVGLPLSGKSTWVDKPKVFYDYDVVCPDDIRLAMGHEFYGPIEPVVWGVVETQVRALLIRKRNVLVDATNLSKWERGKWARLGKEMGVRLIAYQIKTPAQVCIDRAQASGRYNMVPVIHRMMEKYQSISDEEGFEKVEIHAES